MLKNLEILEKQLTNEIVKFIQNPNIEWCFHSINTDNGLYHETEYISTPFRGGYILVEGGNIYFSPSKKDYTWSALVDYEATYIGSSDTAREICNSTIAKLS